MTSTPQSGAYQFALTEMERSAGTAVLAAMLGALCLAVAIGDGFWPAAIIAAFDGVATTSCRRNRRLHNLADQANPHSDLSVARRDALACQAGAVVRGYMPGGLW